MGNTVAPCMCRKEAAGTAAVTTRGRRRPKSFVTGVVPAAGPDAAPLPRRLAVTPRKHQRDDVELEQQQQQQQQQQDETTTRAGPGRSRARARAGGVSWAGGVGDAAAVGKQASGAAAVVTVKIVLKRKDAEALVARLNAQSARERKARMDELKGEFRAGDCGAMSPTPCRDAWKPSLAPIKENYPSGVSL